ncbi:MAG: zinc ribbon domain-containing protein, partial [Thermoplasmata archaeon]
IIILSRTGKIHKIQGRGFRHIVVYVNPKHTSQRCSKCGHVNKNNKHGLEFKCRKRNFKLKDNLKASRNIEVFFIY